MSARRTSLRAHQRYVIEHMVRHPHQHGLIVAHQMGTGKTLLGIGMADALQGRDVLVIAPRQLVFVWQAEAAKYGLAAANTARYSFTTYSHTDLAALPDLSTTVVIMDEAHNAVGALKEMGPAGAASLRRLQAAYKVLLLSGTPIYQDEMDFVYLVNIAAGADVLPYDVGVFNRRFTSVRPARAALVGYWMPIVNIAMRSTQLVGWVLTAVTVVGLLGFAGKALADAPFKALVKPAQRLLRYGGDLAGGRTKEYVAQMVEGLDPGIAVAVVSSLVNLVVGLLAGVNLIVAGVFKTASWQLRTLDTRGLQPCIHKYVSFFEVDNRDYPARVFHKRPVNYTREQAGLFLRFCDGMLPAGELQQLVSGLDDDTAQVFGASLQKGLHDSIGEGLKIGNLRVAGVWPRKFESLLDAAGGGRVPALVYSNFDEHGVQALSEFLVAKGVKHAVVRPTDAAADLAATIARFNRRDIRMVLLHPDMTEGLSFAGARQVHFLEPVMQQAVQDQVVARAIRYRSHSHLPPAERRVDVHTWVATMSVLAFGAMLEKLKRWKDFKKEVLPGTERVKFNYDNLKPDKLRDTLMTPDVIQYTRITSFGENVTILLDAMKKHSIEQRA